MAIVSINEIMDGGARSASWSIEGGRSYQRKFRVASNSQNDGPAVALSALGMKYGDRYNPAYNVHEADLFAYAGSYTVEQEGEDGLDWVVTITYGWYDALTSGGGPDQNPLLMPIEVSWNLRDHELVLEQDINGNAVLNTAGDPFDPPLVIDDPRLVMTVVRNEPIFTVNYVLQYRNAINSTPFAGFQPYYCKVLNIQSRSQFHQLIGYYYQTTYEFEFLSPKVNDNGMGYRKSILNQGMRALSVVTGKPYHITLHGQPINSPMLLRKSGILANPGDPPYFLTIQAYPELDFSIFGFDQAAISGTRSGFSW